jgi:putative ABC transport system substrate-binding protein
MRRREFISLIGGIPVAWPLDSLPQNPSMPIIGFLGNATPVLWADRLRAFRTGLAEAGFVEGNTLSIEYRWAEDQTDRFRALADDLVQHHVRVIAAGSLLAAKAAKAATTTIPIVFCFSADPVKEGLVASLSRPGGNLTGATNLNEEVVPKRLEMLLECIPAAKSIALLANPTYPGIETQVRELQVIAAAQGRLLHVLYASSERDIATAFGSLGDLRAAGLVIATDPLFTSRREKLAALTVSHAIPSIYQ